MSVLKCQLGVWSDRLKASKQNFASPSNVTAFQCFWMASYVAHWRAKVSACEGVQKWCCFLYIKSTSPWWFLATIARANFEEFNTTFTLILMQFGGGGNQEVEKGSDEGWVIGEYTLDISENLAATLSLALARLTLPSWKRMWFLVFQISSMMIAMLRFMVHRSCARIGAFEGFMLNLMMSSLKIIGVVSILSPQHAVAQKALAKW